MGLDLFFFKNQICPSTPFAREKWKLPVKMMIPVKMIDTLSQPEFYTLLIVP